MKLTVQAGSVPPGSYLARLLNCTLVTNKYGEGLQWNSQVVGASHDSAKVGRFTTAAPTPKNACGRLFAGLIGKPLTIAEAIDPQTYIGKVYAIVVVATRTAAPRWSPAPPPT